jgi:acyl-CoA synthetase (AMP-forming)/AMP-acid ligase II
VPLAVVVAKKGMALDIPELLAWCKGRLACFKLPKAAVVVAEIPRKPSGKILERVLREQFKDTVRAPR